jgi:hypothetical protein
MPTEAFIGEQAQEFLQPRGCKHGPKAENNNKSFPSGRNQSLKGPQGRRTQVPVVTWEPTGYSQVYPQGLLLQEYLYPRQ